MTTCFLNVLKVKIYNQGPIFAARFWLVLCREWGNESPRKASFPHSLLRATQDFLTTHQQKTTETLDQVTGRVMREEDPYITISLPIRKTSSRIQGEQDEGGGSVGQSWSRILSPPGFTNKKLWDSPGFSGQRTDGHLGSIARKIPKHLYIFLFNKLEVFMLRRGKYLLQTTSLLSNPSLQNGPWVCRCEWRYPHAHICLWSQTFLTRYIILRARIL